MWARVKGKTENMVLNMGFKDAYAFRPGAILPERGITSRTQLYNVLYVITRPLFPLMKRMKSVTTTTKLGRAMINVYKHPQTQKHLEGEDINRVAELGRFFSDWTGYPHIRTLTTTKPAPRLISAIIISLF